MKSFKKMFVKMYEKARFLNNQNILSFLEENREAKLLDIGCGNGSWTMEVAKIINTSQIYGIDIVDSRIDECRGRGIEVTKADINLGLPFENDFFDVIHLNQVIEHVCDLDKLVSEIYRTLKPGGYVIVSTENASSWHNIMALVMGWQMFSLSNVSSKRGGIGNPLAIHDQYFLNAGENSWSHKIILSFCGLRDFFKAYNFRNIEIKGAGYYPSPAKLGKLEARHAAFLALKAYK